MEPGDDNPTLPPVIRRAPVADLAAARARIAELEQALASALRQSADYWRRAEKAERRNAALARRLEGLGE